MIVTFCGHSTYIKRSSDEDTLLAFLENRIGDTPVEFFLGGYGGFDHFAYGCAKRFQQKHPNAKLVFVTPYLQIKKAEQELGKYDLIVYPELERVPPRYAISRRNKWMVERADVVIAYITHRHGGAYTTYCHAKRKKKEIFDLIGKSCEEDQLPSL